MVSVVVVRPFRHHGVKVSDGQCIRLEALDAAIKAREGYVSLLHGRTYQTRDMVAESPAQAVTIDEIHEHSTPEVSDTLATTTGAWQRNIEVAELVDQIPIVDPVPDAPPKRRRGRPRKNPV